MSVIRTLTAVKPHVQSIRFRARRGTRATQINDDKTLVNEDKRALEWWEVPYRFRRALLDKNECENINCGGAEIIWE